MEIFHQLMYLHFIFVLNKRLIWVANTVFSSFWRSGSSSRREEAIREASFRIKASFHKLATFKLQLKPLCCVPSISPGPRNFKSASAISKPSFVDTMVSILLRESFDIL